MLLELNPKIVSPIWGGKKLKKLKGIEYSETTIGETWEISTHKDGPSFIKNSNELLSNLTELNFLVKLLDTDDVLSIQVHPNDSYANKFENDNGKNECWLILDADIDCGIYLGFKKGQSKESLKQGLLKKENISDLLNFYKVKKGDFFYVPAGTIHAIGKGVTLLEVQQSSGVTYRVWDWNRVDKNGKSRELHIDKSFEVLNDQEECNTLEFFKYKSDLLNVTNEHSQLISDPKFFVELHSLTKDQEFSLDLKKDKTGIVVLSGELEIAGKRIKEFNSLFISEENNLIFKAISDLKFVLVK